MNNNDSKSAVIISADARLQSILSNEVSKQANNLNVSLKSDTHNLSSASKYDAYVYDVELSDRDIPSTISTISDLKEKISDKALILIGKKETLHKITNSEKLDGMIAKTVSKPVSFGQLHLAIETCLKSSQTQQPASRSKGSLAKKMSACALSLLIVVGSAYAFMASKENPSSKETNLSTISQESKIATREYVGDIPPTNKIEQLNELALLAIQERRLSEPENDNAIYFLKKIRQIDPYNTIANQTHSKIFKLLTDSYQAQLLEENNNREIRKILDAILDLEPYNHQYAVYLRELKERIYLARLAQPDKSNTE